MTLQVLLLILCLTYHDDITGFVADTEFYSYSLLAGQAKAHGKLAQDVVSEQDKVEWADMILIISQLQSHGLPALLKGWFDRIMTYNFAFSDGHLYEKGRLRVIQFNSI
jgi:NAD(P)H dehydrogenase (quinone)